jgi:hypothetical protein
MIDCDLSQLVKYQARMFPGAEPYEVIGRENTVATGGAARMANVLLTTGKQRLALDELCELSNVRATDSTRTLATHHVATACSARGWTFTTRKALGMPGKGKLLVRASA